ncbi:interaptin-like [Pseudochaenichthys georgianus]|uniref:interaptin-like n=1 Tax=Pseudochaenichthys georgianus TaxID=52239 RepID=UPI00146AE382|nr:golgin subfamily A member 6-like protein 22 isoform X1 [Pseudochaenichthys georgianus]
MDRRTNQNQRGNPRPFDHGAAADRAYRQIHCRNGWIYGLDEFHMALGEERAGFGHRMRKEKDNVKRLEDLLSNRNSGFDQDNKRLFDIIQYREAEISHLKEQIEAAESQHKQQLDVMVAHQQKLSDQNNKVNLVNSNLLQRREEQLLQCEEKFTKNLAEKCNIWESEKLQMEKKYEEVTQEKNDLDRKNLSRETEFQQLEATLKRVEKQKNDLAKKNKSCETDVKQLKDQMREQEEMFSKDLAQNQESWEKDLKEVQAELKRAEDEKKDSAKKYLSLESEVQLKDGQVKQLVSGLDEQKETFSKDLAEKQLSWELLVQQKEKLVKHFENKLEEQEEMFSKDLAQNQESWEKDLKEVQAELKRAEDEKKDSAKKNLSLESEVQLKDGRVKQLVIGLDEQKETFSKDLAEKQLSWELLVQQKEKLVKHFENKLEEQEDMFSKDLAQNQESWEAKVNLVEIKLKEVTQEKNDLAQKHQSREKDLKEVETKLRKAEDEEKDSAEKNQNLESEVQLKEKQVKQMENQLDEQKMFFKDLAQNQEIWETRVHLTETRWRQVEEQRDDLAKGQLSWEAKEKQMEEENTLLEDLCLHMKNKSRSFFSRRGDTEDRDVALQKMKSKMLEKEMRKKSKR